MHGDRLGMVKLLVVIGLIANGINQIWLICGLHLGGIASHVFNEHIHQEGFQVVFFIGRLGLVCYVLG